MNSTGITRKLDDLGRIVLPMEIRTKFNINPKDALEIFIDGDKIVLKKYEPCCIFCGNVSDNILYQEKRVCRKCIEKLQNS